MVRVSFERVASQFPPETFRLPLDRVAAKLREPGDVLVPQSLLAPQLREGRARVPWSVVADQFPREALALSDTDIATRLPEGALTLPLDEVIRQVPADAFALSSPIVDVRGIEDFPLPFQPHVPPPESATERTATSEAEPAPEPAALSPAARVREPAPEPTRESESQSVEAAAAPTPARDLPPSEREIPSVVRDAGALRFSVPATERRRRVEPGRVAALLKPLLSALEIQEQRVGRLTVLSVASPDLEREIVVDSAAALASLLDDRRLPAPATQATVRGARGTVVLTPLGALGDGAPLLAIAVAASAPLAYLERIALRAAEGAAGNGSRPHPTDGYAADGADMRDAAIPAHVRTLGESFRAFGPVVPTVLQDRTTSLVCYMFLAPRVAARPLAHYARDLREALRGSALGPLDSFVVRMGDDRLVVREVDAGRGAAALLVAGGGPVDRLGLARLELERAVTRLGAR